MCSFFFQESHDRTDKLQCPRCLKTYSLCSDKQGYNPTVASSFVAHLQAHIDKKVQCKKCCLNFITDKELKEHVLKDHVSFRGFDSELSFFFQEKKIHIYFYPLSQHRRKCFAGRAQIKIQNINDFIQRLSWIEIPLQKNTEFKKHSRIKIPGHFRSPLYSRMGNPFFPPIQTPSLNPFFFHFQ